MLGVFDHHLEGVDRALSRKRSDLSARDIGLGAGDRRADRRQQSGLIDAGHFDLDRARRLPFSSQRHFNLTMRVAFQDGGAADSVHRDTSAAGDKSDDLLSGQRMAAQREPNQNVVDPLDANTQAALLPDTRRKRRLERTVRLFSRRLSSFSGGTSFDKTWRVVMRP